MPLSRRFRLRRDDWAPDRQLHRMSAITCPVCETSGEPAAQAGAVLICANRTCGASLVVDADGRTRRATAIETTTLTDAERQTLRKARGRTR